MDVPNTPIILDVPNTWYTLDVANTLYTLDVGTKHTMYSRCTNYTKYTGCTKYTRYSGCTTWTITTKYTGYTTWLWIPTSRLFHVVGSSSRVLVWQRRCKLLALDQLSLTWSCHSHFLSLKLTQHQSQRSPISLTCHDQIDLWKLWQKIYKPMKH